MKKFIATLILPPMIVGCTNNSLKVYFENEPTKRDLSGNKACVEVYNQDFVLINDTRVGTIIKDEAAKVLLAKGFKIEDKVRKAHIAVMFTVSSQINTVHVPSEPLSKQSSIRDKLPEYDVELIDRHLLIQVEQAEHGNYPEVISKGQVYPAKRHQEFFENEKIIKNAVNKLIEGSALGPITRAPATLDPRDPGCWPRLGIDWDEGYKEAQGARIKSFTSKSAAPKAGLKARDIVLKIADMVMPSDKLLRLKADEKVLVIAKRDGKTFKANVIAKMHCADAE